MVSVRLPQELEKKLEELSTREGKNKSALIKEALEEYLAKKEQTQHPFLLGKGFFGKYGSGSGKLSQEYKKIVREKVHAKKSD